MLCTICLESLEGETVSCGRCGQAVHESCQTAWTKLRAKSGHGPRCATCWAPFEGDLDFEGIEAEMARGRVAVRRCLRRVLTEALERRSLLSVPVVVHGQQQRLAGSQCYKAVSHLERCFNEPACVTLDRSVVFAAFRARWIALVTRDGRRSLAPLFAWSQALDDGVRVFRGSDDVSASVKRLLRLFHDLDAAIDNLSELFDQFADAIKRHDGQVELDERRRFQQDRDEEYDHALRFASAIVV